MTYRSAVSSVVEHYIDTVGVTDSNPVSRTLFHAEEVDPFSACSTLQTNRAFLKSASKTMGDDLITNRKALRDYQILETYEAGIVLRGSEVKSLRAGQGNMTDAFARIENNEVWLYQFDIQPYKQANQFNHEPKAVRRLLLHRQEIRKLFGLVAVKGRALVALKMYWKKRHLKVLLGVGIGKNVRDKREDLKKAVAKREMDQAMKESRRK